MWRRGSARPPTPPSGSGGEVNLVSKIRDADPSVDCDQAFNSAGGQGRRWPWTDYGWAPVFSAALTQMLSSSTETADKGTVSTETTVTIESVLPASPPSRKSALLGEILVELGHIDRDSVEAAASAARGAGKPIGEYLVDQNVITGDQLAEALAFRFGVDHVHLSNFAVDMAAANLVASEVAKRLEAVPVGFIGHATLV